MSYDPNLPQDSQEELWLDDLKALLNDDPNYTPAAGKPEPHEKAPVPPLQNGTAPYSVPDFQLGWEQPNPYAQAAQKLYGQPPMDDVFAPGAFPPAKSEKQANKMPRQPKAPRKKNPVVSIIFLSLLVAAEAAGIAAVAISWIQWMQ